ncbi:tyrosine-protein kinase domain-containing protein [uncultured Hyphomicrobium sp.]|uniref:tyrosine-protein kinase domain-containing protein n=1 Tax=uncultured Hyphomicrobium sp. TaxID=194373 RepID=UPI0025F86182|nr:tyrosine-protein kinase domain-containing protein [uncultured Hyphomicrobium sp.]
MQPSGVELREVIGILRRNWLWIVNSIVIALLLAATSIVLTRPTYTATAQIALSPPRTTTAAGQTEAALDPGVLESQLMFIGSVTLLNKVVESEKLLDDPEFNTTLSPSLLSRLLGSTPKDGPDAANAALEATLTSLRKRLIVERIGKSYVIAVSVATTGAMKSVRLANGIARAFIADGLATQVGANNRALRLINPAILPTSPSHPKKVLSIAIGLIGGLMIGVALALLVEARRPGFTSPKQIEGRLGVRVFSVLEDLRRKRNHLQIVTSYLRPRKTNKSMAGAVPVERPPAANYLGTTDAEPERGNVVGFMLGEPFGRYSDGVRGLRTRLQQLNADKPSVVLVSSTVSKEGKTALSMCLAVCAVTGGQRAAIVDCDLRRASLTLDWKLCDRPGVTEFVEKNMGLEQVIHRASDTDISIVPAGAATLDPQAVLTSPRFKQLLTELRKSYDFIVIDSPPIDPVVDAALIAQRADAALMLVRWNSTPQHLVQQAVQRLGMRPEKLVTALTFVDAERSRRFDASAFQVFSNEYQNYYRKH